MKSKVQAVAIGFVSFVLVFVVLFPFSGTDGQPPEHFSVFGYRVPWGDPVWAVLIAEVAGLVVGRYAWRHLVPPVLSDMATPFEEQE